MALAAVRAYGFSLLTSASLRVTTCPGLSSKEEEEEEEEEAAVPRAARL